MLWLWIFSHCSYYILISIIQITPELIFLFPPGSWRLPPTSMSFFCYCSALSSKSLFSYQNPQTPPVHVYPPFLLSWIKLQNQYFSENYSTLACISTLNFFKAAYLFPKNIASNFALMVLQFLITRSMDLNITKVN